jgi:adenylate cyclase
MGDGVNLASRLESLGKHYGVAIIASDVVERDARDVFWFRRLDRVAVHGRVGAVEIYELLGPRVPDRPAPTVVAAYEEALARYFAGDVVRALALLAALRDDPPSRVLATRCRSFLAAPPALDWNGVYVAPTK